MAEVLSSLGQSDPTRTDLFEDSVRKLLEDRVDYAVTASPDHRNIEAVHFLDEGTMQYNAVYSALDSRNGDYLHGTFFVRLLGEFDNWQGPRNRRNHVATRHYWHQRGLSFIHQTDGLAHMGSASLAIPNVDEYSPYTTDPEPVERMQTLMEEMQGVRDGTPVKAASLTPAFIRAAQIHF